MPQIETIDERKAELTRSDFCKLCGEIIWWVKFDNGHVGRVDGDAPYEFHFKSCKLTKEKRYEIRTD